MTARPTLPESRRRSVCVAVALMFVMMAVLLASGCVGGDCPTTLSTVTILKLEPNGDTAWTKMIDNGIDNHVNDLAQTSGGGFITAGSIVTTHRHCTLNPQPRIIQFTKTGDILWDRVFDNPANHAMEVIQMHDGGFVTVFDNGEIYRLDSDGKTVWKRNTGNSSFIWSAIETDDGGVVIAGPEFIKLDHNGNVVWERSYKNELYDGAFSIYEIKANGGFLLFSHTRVLPYGTYETKFDANGNFINSSRIIPAEHLKENLSYGNPDGFELIDTDDKLGVMMTQFDQNGTILDQKKINGSWPITLTEDQGYFYVQRVPRDFYIRTDANFWAIKLDQDGIITWNITIPFIDLNKSVSGHYRVLQTSDAGFVVISEEGIQKDLSS